MTNRDFDVVLFGATGFTGGLTAEYLAARAGSGTRWAIAGRNRAKLEAVRDRLGADVPILIADAGDPQSIARIASSTKAIATTVGPYVHHGEPLVAACAAAGTHYADITGEAEFVDTMYLRHQDTAVRSGARIVHACGFDALPHDLGTQFCVEQLPEGVPLHVRGHMQVRGLFSGGTFDTSTLIMARTWRAVKAQRERRAREHAGAGRERHWELRPRYERELGAFALPFPAIDPGIVLRSAAYLDRYGPDFTYGHYAAVRNPVIAAGGSMAMGAVFLASQVEPLRRRMVGLYPPGEGPSEQRRANAWFKVTSVGTGGGRRVVTRVSGGDPGYTETAKMLAESALCLALDDLPDGAGQQTTAVAMGPVLRERLIAAGMRFDVLSSTG